MHALGTVFAWRAAVLVDALGFTLATANAGTAGAEGRGADDGSHRESGGKYKS